MNKDVSVIESQPNLSPQRNPQKSRSNIQKLLTALILLSVIIIAIFFLKNVLQDNHQSDYVATTPLPTTEPYADWQEYQNEDEGFLVKYPNNWKYYPSSHREKRNDDWEVFYNFTPPLAIYKKNQDATFVLIISKESIRTVEEEIESRYISSYSASPKIGIFEGKLYTSFISDKKTRSLLDPSTNHDTRSHYVAFHNGKSYWFQLSTNKINQKLYADTFSHFISTFRLLDQPLVKRKITYVRNGDIWVIDPNGKNARSLTTQGYNFDPVMSPDGNKIAYFSIDETVRDDFSQGRVLFDSRGVFNNKGINIWIMNVDGTSPKKITNSNVNSSRKYLIWSPDSTYIIYDEDKKIILANADGSLKKNIIGTASIQNLNTDFPYRIWSPDSKKIAIFTLSYSGDQAINQRIIRPSQVYIYDLNGKQLEKHLNLPPLLNVPHWSPLDKRFYYIKYSSENYSYGVESIDIDGSNRFFVDIVRVDQAPHKNEGYAAVRNVVFSPDGKKLIGTFVTENKITQDEVTALFIGNSDGTAIRLMPSGTEGSYYEFQTGIITKIEWMPDNKRVVFRTDSTHFLDEKDLSKVTKESSIHIINIDGLDHRILDQYHLYDHTKLSSSVFIEDDFSTGY